MTTIRIIAYTFIVAFSFEMTYGEESFLNEKDLISTETQKWVERGYPAADSIRLARCKNLPDINVSRLTRDGAIDPNERRLLDRAFVLNKKVKEYDAIAEGYDEKVKALMREVEAEQISLAVAKEKLSNLRENSAETVLKREEEREKLKMTVSQINGTIAEQGGGGQPATRPESK